MSDSENEADAEFPVEETGAAKIEVETDQPAKRRGGGIAWLALLVAASAFAASGYLAYKTWTAAGEDPAAAAHERVDSLQGELDSTSESVAALSTRIDALAADDDTSEAIEALEKSLDERLEQFGSLPPRMATLESSVASLAGISEGARETFLLAEAEYYLQIANAQLQLANNPELAALALGMADERVTQLADPGLTAVRRALSDEQAALATMQKPDIEGASLTLASLARVVESLPLAGPVENPDAAEAAADADAGNLERAWSSVKGAMTGLVRITPPDQAKLQRLSPDAEYFLRNNIALQMQAARLALLRGEQAIFDETLDDTATLLGQYFDADSEAVQSTLDTLAATRGSVRTSSPPDISGSLRLLRQYRTVRENAG